VPCPWCPSGILAEAEVAQVRAVRVGRGAPGQEQGAGGFGREGVRIRRAQRACRGHRDRRSACRPTERGIEPRGRPNPHHALRATEGGEGTVEHSETASLMRGRTADDRDRDQRGGERWRMRRRNRVNFLSPQISSFVPRTLPWKCARSASIDLEVDPRVGYQRQHSALGSTTHALPHPRCRLCLMGKSRPVLRTPKPQPVRFLSVSLCELNRYSRGGRARTCTSRTWGRPWTSRWKR
jgi:hypothetical protein